MALLDPAPAFVWGANGARLTPDEIAQQRKEASDLLTSGMSYAPVASPWQGWARVAQALVGGLESGQADAASKQNAIDNSAMVQALLGGSAAPSAVAAPSIAQPVTPSNPTADVIRAGLIQRGLPANVADGFVMNFRDESGLNPGINETSPIVPGSRGGYGLAQWTGPRRVALEQFASSQGKPVSDLNTQLDYLVSELQGPEAKAAQQILGTKTPQDAAVAIARDFLRPSPYNLERRVAQYGGGASETAATSARPAGINPVIVQAMTSPYASPQTKQIAGLLFKSQLDAQAKANDPAHQLDIQAKQLGIREAQNKLAPVGKPFLDDQGNYVQKDALGNIKVLTPADKTPTSVSEYKYYADQERAAGRTPMDYGPWTVARARAGAMSINTGQIPAGYEQYQTPDGGIALRPIPGGPKDTTKQDQVKADNAATSTSVITNAAKLARDALNASGLPASGTMAATISPIGETNAAELRRQIDVLKSNASIEALNQMRQQSKTGGALGSVTEGEERLLAAKSGALDPKAPRDKVQSAINDYERTLLEIVHGKEAGDRIFEATRQSSPAGRKTSTGVTWSVE